MMSRKTYSSPKLIVLTRFSEENVLAACKANIGNSETHTYRGCGHEVDEINCVGCEKVSKS